MTKFELEDKVLFSVNGKEIEGIVVGCNVFYTSNKDAKIEYRVAHKINKLDIHFDTHFEINEFMGQCFEYATVDQNMLKKVDSPETNDFVDALTYSLRKDNFENNSIMSDEALKTLEEEVWNSFLDINNKVRDDLELSINDNPKFVSLDKHLPKEECNHVWALYDSGFSRFDYCSICDKKKFD